MASQARPRIRDIARRTAGLTVASVVLGFGALALAQTPDAPAPAAPNQARFEARAQARTETRARTAAAVTQALGAGPVAADRVAVGRRLITAMGSETSLNHMLEVSFASLRAQMLGALPAEAPASRQAAFGIALDEAVAETRADILDELLNGLARYYALRVDPESLTETATFLESPLGRRWIASPKTMSEADSQALGQYGLTHPALIEVYAAAPGGFDVTQTILHPGGAPTKETVRIRLCRSLKTRGVTEAVCGEAR